MNRRLEQHARNEALMREVNERIEKVDKAAEEATDLGRGQMHFDFLCECGNGSAAGCAEHIEMTLEEYEEVRSEDDRFALYPGHEDEALERVIRRTEKFVIVDKKAAAEPFVEDDPRGAPSQ
jgi:hypothetical protein